MCIRDRPGSMQSAVPGAWASYGAAVVRVSPAGFVLVLTLSLWHELPRYQQGPGRADHRPPRGRPGGGGVSLRQRPARGTGPLRAVPVVPSRAVPDLSLIHISEPTRL